MTKSTNKAGRQLVVDRLIELKKKGGNFSGLSLSQSISNNFTTSFSQLYTLSIDGPREVTEEGIFLTANIYKGTTLMNNAEFVIPENFSWSVEGDESTKSGKSILLTSSNIDKSPSTVTCTWSHYYNSDNQTGVMGEGLAALTTNISISWADIIQYTSSASADEDFIRLLPNEAWHDEKPLQTSSSYIWRRVSNDNGKSWMYFRETGEQGEQGPQGPQGPQGEPGKDGQDGKAPVYYYKWTKTNDPDAWKGGAIAFRYGNKLMTYGDTLMMAGNGAWSTEIPQGIQYEDDYLWTKIVHPDGKVDIIPPAQKGTPAVDFSIEVNPSTYLMTEREYVKTKQVLKLNCVKINYTRLDKAEWSVLPDNSDKVYFSTEGGEKLEGNVQTVKDDIAYLTIDAGAEFKSIRIVCKLAEVGEREKIVTATYNVFTPEYLGKVDETLGQTYPTMTAEGPVRVGDVVVRVYEDVEGNKTSEYMICTEAGIDEDGERYTNWAINDVDSDNNSKLMIAGIYDAILSGSQNADMLQMVHQLVARYISAEYIRITGAIHGGKYDRNGNLITDPSAPPTGFYLGTDGVFKAIQAFLSQITIEGLFNCYDRDGKIIFQTKKTEQGETVEYESTFTRWKESQVIDAINLDSYIECSFNGKTYHASKIDFLQPSRERIYLESKGAKKTIEYTTTVPCYVSINIYSSTYTSGGMWVNPGQGGASFNIEGYANGAVDKNNLLEYGATGWHGIVAAGTKITASASGGTGGGSSDNPDAYWETYSRVSGYIYKSDPDIFCLSSEVGKTEYKFTRDGIRAVENTLVLQNFSPVLDMICFDDLIPKIASLPLDVVVAVENNSWLEKDNVTYDVISVTRSSDYISIVLKGGISELLYIDTDFSPVASNGWYNHEIKLYIEPYSDISATLIDRIKPVNENSMIGRVDEKFPSGYFENLNSTMLTGNVNIEGTSFKVWGAVAN